MKIGNLVGVWGKDARGLTGPIHLGILVEYDYKDEGWKVMTEDGVETFASVFWHVQEVRGVQNENW